MRPLPAATLAAGLLILGGCGGPAHTTAPITFRGAVSGTFLPGLPGSCGPGKTTVTGAYGPDHQLDLADLTINDDGSIVLALVGARGTFTGKGVVFRPRSGWDLDARLTNGLTRSIQVRGHLDC